MNNKGFAISGILYSILIIFVASIAIMLYNLQNKKTVLDQVKIDSVEAVNLETKVDYITDKYNKCEEELNNISTNTYLRYDEENGYIQVLDDEGNWVDVYSTVQLPIINKRSITPLATSVSATRFQANSATVANIDVTNLSRVVFVASINMYVAGSYDGYIIYDDKSYLVSSTTGQTITIDVKNDIGVKTFQIQARNLKSTTYNIQVTISSINVSS